MDLPIIFRNIDGFYHREDGPAIESTDCKEWWVNGLLHREDGPAVEFDDGYREWRVNHKCHRIDGPAIEYADGTKKWYINGNAINCSTQEEFLRIVKMKAFW